MTDPYPNLARVSVRHRLTGSEQRACLEDAREVIRAAPLVRNVTPGGRPMSVRTTNAGALGWVSGPEGYRYSPTDTHGQPWPKIPVRWLEIASAVAGDCPWDCALVNWYDLDATLGWHRDDDERDLSAPIVTISLGCPARWAIRLHAAARVHRTVLESGDVTLLAGETRPALHSVERLEAGSLLSPLSQVDGRVSITLRVAG